MFDSTCEGTNAGRLLVGLAVSTLSFVPPPGVADGKLEVDATAYVRWNSIDATVLSPDGRWIAYTVTSGSGDGELVVRSAIGSDEYRVARGIVPPPNSRGELGTRLAAKPGGFAGGRATQFTADSRFVVFSIASTFPIKSNTSFNRSQVSGNEAMALGVLRLSDGKFNRIRNVTRFALPRAAARYLAYLEGEPYSVGSASEPSVREGALVLVDLADNTTTRVPHITDFTFDATSEYLAYSVSTSGAGGVYVRQLRTGAVTRHVRACRRYEHLTFDHAGRQFAFFADCEVEGSPSAGYSIFYAASPLLSAKPVVYSAELSKAGLQLSSRAGLRFTTNGHALTFHLESDARIASTVRRDTARGDGGSRFELWHWQDPEILSHRKFLTANRLFTTYPAVYNLRSGRFYQLGSESAPNVLLTEDAQYALVIDQSPYMIQSTWGEQVADLYVVEVASGQRRRIRNQFRTGQWLPYAPFTTSPTGRYLLFFEDRRWFSFELKSGQLVDLTGNLIPTARFELDRRRHGSPTRRPDMPVGIAGWTANDQSVLVYDQRDIWKIDPSGERAPKNITHNLGSKQNIIFRIWPHEWDWLEGTYGQGKFGEAYQETESLLFTAYDEDTIATGFWHGNVHGDMEPKPLLMINKRVRLLAKHHGRYLVTQQTFSEFPDLWVGSSLDRLRRISNANPQQQEYWWGSTEVVNWISAFGAPLKGVLYRPELFDIKKRYPLIVDAIGSSSHQLHTYTPPQAASSAAIRSPVTYVSKGYLVFKPDIVSATGLPGESALAAVVPGVRALIDHGFVDRHRIALVGTSWGGYATTYIITQTDMFRCAVESAGFTNAISAYSGLMGSGAVLSFAHERGAMMYGSSIWENPYVYLINSPLMLAANVQTPLLMLHNDKDEQVPFMQAVELYVAMRRNSKEAYLFNYNDEGHELFNDANRLDWDSRMQNYLDHCLRDAPRPSWINLEAPDVQDDIDSHN